MLRSIFILFLIVVLSCKDNATPNAQAIIDQSIEYSGGNAYDEFELEFDFRDRHYISSRSFGNFEYKRITRDSLSEIRDTYSNRKPFSREVDGESVEVPDSMASRYENSINSVNYFLFLPYGLNDEAVNKTFLGEAEINGKNYYKIEVTFDKEGGGKDFEDVFLYWIDKENYSMDFLAYQYYTDGGGIRFRESFNVRNIGGIRFADYRNYKPKNKSVTLEDLDELFSRGELELLSLIETRNIEVR